MDRVWDIPKRLVGLCQVKVIQGHEVKKIKFEALGLDDVIHVFRSYFRYEREK